MLNDRTIVALATARAEAGLAVVRVSGPEARQVANRVFTAGGGGTENRAEWCCHRAVYGILKWPTDSHEAGYGPDETIDQVIALPLLAPRSYTGEDTIEFFCHGGRVVADAVVAACRAAGATPAAAGEFTRRAFLNGRMSLDQAEAVADLIHAESSASARAAMGQLLGGLNRQLAEIEAPLLELLGRIEGALEFVAEEGLVEIGPEAITGTLSGAMGRIDELLNLSTAGRLLRDGVQIVLVGPPNVGKSSLFNALLQQERALVDDEAGTTRDVVSSRIVRDGSVYVLHDTAGLRESGGRVEQMGMDRTRQQAAEADIVLELAAFGENGPPPGPKSTPVGPEVNELPAQLVVRTKMDLFPAAGGLKMDEAGIATSAVSGEGIPELWARIEAVVERCGLAAAIQRGVVLNERHRSKLTTCRAELNDLLELCRADKSNIPGQEVIGTMLASILSELGEVTGRVFSEQLLEHVFNRFCVGK